MEEGSCYLGTLYICIIFSNDKQNYYLKLYLKDQTMRFNAFCFGFVVRKM